MLGWLTCRISKLLCISCVDFVRRNNPPRIKTKSRPEMSLPNIENQGYVNFVIWTILNSNASRISIARPKPICLALFRCCSGNLPTSIEIKIMLSIPNTISRAINVLRAIHASGFTTHSTCFPHLY